MTPRSWTVSLALHGLAVASFLALMPSGPAPKPPEPWLVSLVAAPAVPAVEPTPRDEPLPQSMPSSYPSPKPVAKQAVHDASVPVTATKRPPQVVEVQEPVVATQAVLNPLPTPSPPAPDVPPTQVVLAQTQAQDPVSKVPTAMASEPPRSAIRPQPTPALTDRTDPPPVPANKEAQQRWYAALAAKLAQMKRYPLVARRMGQEGVVVLEARFRKNGEATASVKQSSGHSSLDRAAVKLFEDAISALEGAVIPVGGSVLEIPVAYRLES